MSRKTVVLVGTLDTKGAEYQYMRDRLALAGVKTILVDVGTLDRPLAKADITREEVAAAAAIAGMVNAPPVELGEQRPLIAATMFGVTTPSVTAAREELERRGYEVLTFHATGTGGRAMEALVESGFVTGVLDITTTELADELVGGVLSAGPDRLEIARKLGAPPSVSVGALGMVHLRAPDTGAPPFES